MSIRVECSCGKSMQADDVFAGGQVKCACGAMVPVPAVDPRYVDKIRFHCPHCNMRVLGKRASVGKKSKCPACRQTYVIPEPKEEPALDSNETTPAGFSMKQRIRIEPTDIAFLAEVVSDLVDSDGETAETSGHVEGASAEPAYQLLGASDAGEIRALEIQAEPEDSGISDVPPDRAPVEIRIDLTGGRGTPLPAAAAKKPASPSRVEETLQREQDELFEAMVEEAVSETPAPPPTPPSLAPAGLVNSGLLDLDRKTELPVEDDTIRTPTRPVPQPGRNRAAAARNRSQPELPPERIVAEAEAVIFIEDALPAPTIPVDELRLVDSCAPTDARILAEEFLPRPRQSTATGPSAIRNLQSEILLPRPASKRPLSSPPTGGVSVYSPIVRPRAQPGTCASLVFDDGESAGQKIPLRVRNFLIGRERDCHFRPKSASVSHHHCVLKTDAYSVRIRDLGSRNGTFVNGHRIYQEVLLHHSDNVWIGDVRFKVDIPHDLYAGYQASEAQLSMDEFRIY